MGDQKIPVVTMYIQCIDIVYIKKFLVPVFVPPAKNF